MLYVVVSIFYKGTLVILSNLHFASLASVALHFPSLHHCYLLPAKIFTVSVSSYLLYFTWHNILQVCPSAHIVTHHQAIFNSTESLLVCAEACQWGTMYAYSFALITCTLGIRTAARSHPLCCLSLKVCQYRIHWQLLLCTSYVRVWFHSPARGHQVSSLSDCNFLLLFCVCLICRLSVHRKYGSFRFRVFVLYSADKYTCFNVNSMLFQWL